MSARETVVGPGTFVRSGETEPDVRECPHGPTLVRGATEVVHEGEAHPVDHPVVAVCRCGKSTVRPWCDSTHRAIPGY